MHLNLKNSLFFGFVWFCVLSLAFLILAISYLTFFSKVAITGSISQTLLLSTPYFITGLFMGFLYSSKYNHELNYFEVLIKTLNLYVWIAITTIAISLILYANQPSFFLTLVQPSVLFTFAFNFIVAYLSLLLGNRLYFMFNK